MGNLAFQVRSQLSGSHLGGVGAAGGFRASSSSQKCGRESSVSLVDPVGCHLPRDTSRLKSQSQSQPSPSSLAPGPWQTALGGERAEPRKEPARGETRPQPHLLSSASCTRSQGQLIFSCFPASRSGEKNTNTASSQPEPQPWSKCANERQIQGAPAPLSSPLLLSQPSGMNQCWFVLGRATLHPKS